MEIKSFFIDDWLVSPAEGTLSRQGETVRLEPKVMEVLVYFAAHPNEVISRDELERDVWHGALVGYDAVTATIIKLRKALKDEAKQPRFIVTIPKKGYKLVATVQPSTESTAKELANTASSTNQNTPRFKLSLPISMALISISLLIATFLFTQISNQPETNEKLIVLPFENIGGVKEHEIFVEGITEDIITDLSKISKILVMSSNTTFKYAGLKTSAQELNNELDVDYVVKGNTRRHANKIRINIQLINAKTGYNIWAQRYDKDLEDVFSIQKEITNKLIEKLSLTVTTQEKQRLAQRATNNLLAYDFFLSGQRSSKLSTRDTNIQSAESYRQAINNDPAYGRAYGALAFILAVDYLRGWTDTPIETLDRAMVLAEQGVSLDNTIPQTHWVQGYVHLMRKEYLKAERAVKKAIDISPSYADGYGLLALIYNNLGNSQKAIEFAQKGMKINPYYTWDYLFNLGRAYYALNQYTEAIDVLEKAQERNERAVPVKLYLTASYIQSNRLDDAEWIVEQLKISNPNTTISHIDKTTPIANPSIKKQLLIDLQKAGLPNE